MNNFRSAKQCFFPSLQVSLIQPTRSDVPLAQSLDKKTSSEMFLTSILVECLPSKSSTEIELQADKKTTMADTFVTTSTVEGSF
jgi:hypothetical protein